MAFGDKVEFKLEPPLGVEDWRGRVFERLTVVEYLGKDSSRQPLWKCVCIEGNEVIARAYELKKGRTQSCGCLAAEKISANYIKNYTDKQFWYLIGIKPLNKKVRSSNHIIWLWRCVFNGPGCKGEIELNASAVTLGKIKSCGCATPHLFKQSLKAMKRVWEKGEDKEEAVYAVEVEYEQEQMKLAAEREKAAAMNWSNKLPEPVFNWSNKLPEAITTTPDFDWWKDKLKGQDNA